MLRVLRCLLILVIVILASLDVSMGTPLNAQDMSMGMSPFKIEQGTDTESPELATSALKAIGRSCGPTEVNARLQSNFLACQRSGSRRFHAAIGGGPKVQRALVEGARREH